MSDGPSLLKTMAAAVELHQQHHRLAAVPSAVVPDAVPSLAKEAAILKMVNNADGRAPPLTLMKRINTPEKEEPNMADAFSTLLKSAVQNLEQGNLEQAERLLDKASKFVEDNSTHTHHHYHGSNNSNDDDEMDWDDENGGYAKVKRSSNTNFKSPSDPSNDAPDDEDEDDNGNNRKVAKWAHDQNISKWSDDYHLPHYGGTESPEQPTTTHEGPPQKGDTYNVSTTATTALPLRSSFDGRVEMIRQRDGISMNAAQQKARVEFPDEFVQHQNYIAESPTSAQHMRRYPVGAASKRAPTTWEDYIAIELSKGAPNEEVAGVRVLQQHGSFALRNRMIRKGGPSVSRTFAKRATEIMQEDGCSRTEALRKLRLEEPSLYDALNAS
jgi:hypothetical protein